MANIIAKDGAGDTKYIKATGAGTNVDPFISDHYISSIAAGDNNIGNVDVASIAAGTSLIGKVSIDQITANANEVVVKSALPAGTNAIGKLSANSGVDIGDVDVLSMPVTHIIADSGTIGAVTAITNALPAGDNNIGNVDIVTFPADPFGTNADVAVVTDANGSISSKLRGIIKLLVDKITVKLDTGTNIIGKVSIDQSTANANEIVVKSGVITSVTSITNALPAGTNAIGKLSANSGVDIGDVDVLSMPVTHVIADSGTITAVTGITNAVSVKGTGFSIANTLTVTNGAYSISDVVGGLITLANAVSANGKSAIINTITLGGVAAIPYELWFLNADIATPRTDNGVFDIVAADEDKILGVVPIAAIDYNSAQSAFNFATIRGIGLQVKAGASATSIYAYLKATATTSPATTTLYLKVSGEWID